MVEHLTADQEVPGSNPGAPLCKRRGPIFELPHAGEKDAEHGYGEYVTNIPRDIIRAMFPAIREEF